MKILYEIKSGSHLYGLNTPSSDLDYVGVYIEDDLFDYLDLFKNKDEMDMSVKSKQENGKNDKDAIDRKFYHITKFLKLLTENNPNILEMLFAPDDCIISIDPLFKKYFINRKELFVSKRLIPKFIGYAISQEQKSYTKSDNYLILDKFRYGLNNFNKSYTISDVIETGFEDAFKDKYTIEFKKHSKTNIERVLHIGDMQFPSGLNVKETLSRINDRFDRATHRVDGMLINRYDPKFMSHTLRLLFEGIELLTTGNLVLPFKGETKDMIMNVKLGITDVSDIPGIINSLKHSVELLEKSCTLKEKPDYDLITKEYYWFIKDFYDITLEG